MNYGPKSIAHVDLIYLFIQTLNNLTKDYKCAQRLQQTKTFLGV